MRPPAVRAREPTVSHVGAETREDEEGGENDRDGIDRIREKEHEALNECDFEKHVAEAERGEIDASRPEAISGASREEE